ncbi:DUF4157 domain-containing protein [Rheinheimera sp. YQF-2]|uniref:DUF4157 domain-containing protein n=2 Tax=Rheinheimera lutimaris TaxID=2740584 RepID=A0A7Y5ASP2_9GAMM|nr:DUF4157 domain-containing protein [Rheinheimera lutimaris]
MQQAALEEEEPLQGKFAVVQQAALEEEDPLQGKFALMQQAAWEEEEPLQGKFAVVQQAALEEEEPLQGKFAVLQQAALDEEEPIQGKFEPAAVSQRQAEASSNNTGMPDQLKSGIESLSGYAMDDVKVHYNSAKPAQMQAHAYAQGTDIHLAPGQEQHLPHEAWHVVQQKQGRVKATTQLKGEAINDDPGLEHEADVMGARSLNIGKNSGGIKVISNRVASSDSAIQAVWDWVRVDDNLLKWGELLDSVQWYYIKDSNLMYFEFEGKVTVDNKNYTAYAGKKNERTRGEWVKLRGADPLGDAEILSEDILKTINIDEQLFDKPEEVTFGEEGGEGALGYAIKMLNGMEKIMAGIESVFLTTGSNPSQHLTKQVIDPEVTAGRRPGLSIRNYSKVYSGEDGKELIICNIKGHGLMKQFALALQLYAKNKLGAEIKVATNFEETSEVLGNYERLKSFFESYYNNFKEAKTLVFGYASAFENVDGVNVKYSVSGHGWVGTLYFHESSKLHFAVFDSDLVSSYHVEILAENIKRLLSSEFGNNIKDILIGGSAGSLLPEKSNDSQSEEALESNVIYTPESILRPDGYFVPNALHGFGESTVKGSMHSSVVSALSETPNVLEGLSQFGIKTVDMEFGYVAAGIMGNPDTGSKGPRTVDDINFGVACLITDYPKVPSKSDLSKKDSSAKKRAKEAFVKTITDYLSKK